MSREGKSNSKAQRILKKRGLYVVFHLEEIEKEEEHVQYPAALPTPRDLFGVTFPPPSVSPVVIKRTLTYLKASYKLVPSRQDVGVDTSSFSLNQERSITFSLGSKETQGKNRFRKDINKWIQAANCTLHHLALNNIPMMVVLNSMNLWQKLCKRAHIPPTSCWVATHLNRFHRENDFVRLAHHPLLQTVEGRQKLVDDLPLHKSSEASDFHKQRHAEMMASNEVTHHTLWYHWYYVQRQPSVQNFHQFPLHWTHSPNRLGQNQNHVSRPSIPYEKGGGGKRGLRDRDWRVRNISSETQTVL
jgi:hypothetical protein